MALMGVNIDKRQTVGINVGVQAVYAHGLPATPDTVQVRVTQALAAASNTPFLCILVDATNVSISNCGTASAGGMEMVACRFHSMIW